MATFLRCARLAATTGARFCKLGDQGTLVYAKQTRNFCVTANKLADRKYTEGHEWVIIDGDVGTVGLSDHAQDSLGDIVFVELPEEGNTYEKDDECGVVESVKAVSEIFSPLSGEITETNQEAKEDPAIINKDCYGKGWLFKLKLSKTSEIDGLMDEESYKSFLESQ